MDNIDFLKNSQYVRITSTVNSLTEKFFSFYSKQIKHIHILFLQKTGNTITQMPAASHLALYIGYT